MASNVKRHVFSTEDLSKIEESLQRAIVDLEKAQKDLAQLKRAKTSLQQKHTENAHKYRYQLHISLNKSYKSFGTLS